MCVCARMFFLFVVVQVGFRSWMPQRLKGDVINAMYADIHRRVARNAYGLTTNGVYEAYHVCMFVDLDSACCACEPGKLLPVVAANRTKTTWHAHPCSRSPLVPTALLVLGAPWTFCAACMSVCLPVPTWWPASAVDDFSRHGLLRSRLSFLWPQEETAIEGKRKRSRALLEVLVKGQGNIPPSLIMFAVGLIRHWGDSYSCRKALGIAHVRKTLRGLINLWES